MAWDSSKPITTTKIKDGPGIFIGNWAAWETFTEEEHYGIDTATTSGKHKPGDAGVVFIGTHAMLTANAYQPATGSMGVATDKTSGALCMYVCTATTNCGDWTNYSPSHVLVSDLACGDPHPQYCRYAGDTISGEVVLTGDNILSSCNASASPSVDAYTQVFSAYCAIYLSGAPRADDEAVIESYLASSVSASTLRPYWTSTNHSYVVFDSGRISHASSACSCHRITHNLGTEPDIVMLYLYPTGTGVYPSLEMSPAMHMGGYSSGPMIIAQGANTVDVVGRVPSLDWYDIEATDINAKNPDIRIICIDKDPTWDTGWIAEPAAFEGTRSLTADYNTFPKFYTLEVGEKSDGSGWRGYSMGGQLGYTGVYMPHVQIRCTITHSASAYPIYLQTGYNKVAYFYDFNGALQDIDSWSDHSWCYRFKTWDWEPDYESSWTYVATGNRFQAFFQHNLGQVPYLYLVEFCADPTNTSSIYITPLMGPSIYTTNGYGTVVSMHENFATVICGYRSIASLYSAKEADEYLGNASGYIKLKAWCT